MNQTKIEWTDRTLNAVVGCTHNCGYCYARGQAHRSAHRQAGAWLKRKLGAKKFELLKSLMSEGEMRTIHEGIPVWCQDCHDFKPHAHLERLDQITPRQDPKKIFMDSMWDFNCKDNDPVFLFHRQSRNNRVKVGRHAD